MTARMTLSIAMPYAAVPDLGPPVRGRHGAAPSAIRRRAGALATASVGVLATAGLCWFAVSAAGPTTSAPSVQVPEREAPPTPPGTLDATGTALATAEPAPVDAAPTPTGRGSR